MKVRCNAMNSGSIGVRSHGATQFKNGIAEIPEDRFDALAEALATIDCTLTKVAERPAPKPRRKAKRASRRTA